MSMERERQPIPDTPLSSLPTTAPASAGAWFFPQPSRRGHVTPRKVWRGRHRPLSTAILQARPGSPGPALPLSGPLHLP